jgi:hypothetical protein
VDVFIRRYPRLRPRRRGLLSAESAALAPRQFVEIAGLLAEYAQQRLAPGSVLAKRMLAFLSHALDGEAQQIDAVARREIELQFVGLLQKLDGQSQQFRLGER